MIANSLLEIVSNQVVMSLLLAFAAFTLKAVWKLERENVALRKQIEEVRQVAASTHALLLTQSGLLDDLKAQTTK